MRETVQCLLEGGACLRPDASLREMCPNTELFLVKNIGKYGPEITPYLDTFHTVLVRGNTVNILQIPH